MQREMFAGEEYSSAHVPRPQERRWYCENLGCRGPHGMRVLSLNHFFSSLLAKRTNISGLLNYVEVILEKGNMYPRKHLLSSLC